jgi:hypothetical protein
MRQLAVVLTAAAVLAVPSAARSGGLGGDVIEQETITLPARITVENGARKDRPGNCSAVSFAMWTHVPGSVSAHVYYTWRGRDYDKQASKPFSNRYKWVIEYRAPEGKDWIQLGKSWGDGPTPNDCSEAAAKYRKDYVREAFVDVVIESNKACKEARKALRAWTRQVDRLEGRRDGTPGLDDAGNPSAEEQQLEADIQEATRQRKRAQARVRDLCD